MRARASALALFAGLVLAAPALADPSEVYVDYASDGTLSCGHSRGDLEGILTDASVNEYGDPLTLVRLKLVVRRQLANGCGPRASTPPPADDEQPAETAPPPRSERPPAESAGDETAAPGEDAGDSVSIAATDPPATTESAPTETTTTMPLVSESGATTSAAAAPAADDGDGGDGGGGGGAAPLVGVLALGAAAIGAAGFLARRTLTRSE